MQRAALKRRVTPQRDQVAEIQAVPAPVGGWNARDALPAMAPSDAIVLENYVPNDDGVTTRGGTETAATTMTGSYVETVMVFDELGTAEIFAATPTKIYDVTSAGAATEVVTGTTNGRWQHVTFSNAAGNWLLLVNGADGLRSYNGTSWATETITGASNPIAIANHMQRVWLVEENSLDAYYLDVNAKSGTATKINFSYEFTLGGKVMALGSWTRDGGSGSDDYLVVISSKGELLVYQGTDPDDAATWSRVGRFIVPTPLGRRCIERFGGDLLILTEQGLISMADMMAKAESQQSSNAITDKISGAFKSAAQSYRSAHGWQVIQYPTQNLLIINVPTEERVSAVQFVQNTRTGAWCKWTGINVNCWGRTDNRIYAGTNAGTTIEYGQTTEDDGVPITCISVQAHNTFGTPEDKTFTQIRPYLRKPVGYEPMVSLLFDFDPDIPSFSPPAAVSSGPTWDEVYWDEEYWGGSSQTTLNWIGVEGHGVAAAVVVVSQSETPVTYNGGLIAYVAGGF